MKHIIPGILAGLLIFLGSLLLGGNSYAASVAPPEIRLPATQDDTATATGFNMAL